MTTNLIDLDITKYGRSFALAFRRSSDASMEVWAAERSPRPVLVPRWPNDRDGIAVPANTYAIFDQTEHFRGVSASAEGVLAKVEEWARA